VLTSEEPADAGQAADTRLLIMDLNELIALCRNAEKGYVVACSRVEAPLLRSLLASYAEQRAAFADTLQAEVVRLGGTAETTGDLAGSFHRLWLRLKYLASPRDATVIAECIVGDAAALEVYEEVRRKQLPEPVQDIVDQQYSAVRAARDRLNALHRTRRLGGRNGQV
jgi:uncharacterized protein (TIGR02284 family)